MSKGARAAVSAMLENGISDSTSLPLDLIAFGFGATVKERPLDNADGRIVFGRKKAVITINSEIEFEGRKRFALAHEIGHLVMHRNYFIAHNDSARTLQYFKAGNQESEANDFASELLMPEKLFVEACNGMKFSPDLLRSLAHKFQSSITSVAYKYFNLGPHPICLAYSVDNVVHYRKWPDNYPHYLTDRTRLPPPYDSVAAKYFDKGKIYFKAQSKQQIWKSTWFELKHWENDQDFNFYEYCVITPNYGTCLSVIWEE